MAQGSTQASAQTQVQTVLLRECSLVMRVFDANGNEVKPTTLEVSRSGRIEAWQLPQGKAIIATVNPFHYEDEYDTIDSYRVKLYCFDGASASMKLVGVVFISNPLDDIANYVRDVLAGCQQSN